MKETAALQKHKVNQWRRIGSILEKWEQESFLPSLAANFLNALCLQVGFVTLCLLGVGERQYAVDLPL